MLDQHWIYTTRCKCCGEPTDYVVPKERYTHEKFADYVRSMPLASWFDCEKCGRMTVQEVVAYEHSDPPETESEASDTTRLDWMDKMRADCEGHVLSRCFMPGDQTLRERIDDMMKLNEQAESP